MTDTELTGGQPAQPTEAQQSPVQAPQGVQRDREVQPPISAQKAPQRPFSQVSGPTTGDAGVDAALRIVMRAGVPQDNRAVQAALNGDLVALESLLQYIQADDADIALQLLRDAGTRRTAEADRAQQETVDRVYNLVGGEAEWDKITAWVKQVADPDELAELVDDLEAGGRTAYRAAQYVHGLYVRANGAVPEQPSQQPAAQQPAVNPGNFANGSTDKPLTAIQYASQIGKLLNENPGLPDDHPAILDLQRRRLAAMRAGY